MVVVVVVVVVIVVVAVVVIVVVVVVVVCLVVRCKVLMKFDSGPLLPWRAIPANGHDCAQHDHGCHHQRRQPRLPWC